MAVGRASTTCAPQDDHGSKRDGRKRERKDAVIVGGSVGETSDYRFLLSPSTLKTLKEREND